MYICNSLWDNHHYPSFTYHILITLVNVYVDLVVFTRIAGTLKPEVVDIGLNTM